MKKILLILLFFIGAKIQAQTFTQQVNASAGGFYNQINGSMQFTIGEPLTETYTNSSAKMYQGFEQGSYTLVSVTELPVLAELDVNLYPNPSPGTFNVSVESKDNIAFRMDVIDAQGKLIVQKDITAKTIEMIDLSAFASNIYYVSIINADKTYIKTFKIIKQ